MPPQESKLNFLLLPQTARLRIYEYILIGKPQLLPYRRPPASHPLTPSILRTCKQIHREASPILYTKNTFLICHPERILAWFARIGRDNIRLLNNIRIFVEGVYSTQDTFFSSARESSAWYKVLARLAREATGLRHVWIYWDAEEEMGHYGAGMDLRFVRELAKISGLQSMVIDGFYAMHWPQYLTEKMGVPIQEEEPSQYRRMYQRGTENLVP